MYNKEDISNILNCSISKAYNILKKLQEMLKQEQPEILIIRGRIPKSYFEKKVLGKEV